MTSKKTLQKATIITSVALTLLLSGVFLLSEHVKFAEAGTIGGPPPPPSSVCPEEGTVQHWDKIIFVITEDSQGFIPESFLRTELDLKIIDEPGVVVNLKSEIVRHLQKTIETPEPIDPSRLTIEVLDVMYETVICGLSGPVGPQGPAGPKGDKGDSFDSTYVKRTIASLEKGTGETPVSVDCEDGDAATGGGIRKPMNMDFRADQPIPGTTFGTPTGWFAIFDNKHGGQVEVFVVCLGDP